MRSPPRACSATSGKLTDQRFAGQLADAGLAPVGSLDQFTDRRTEIAAELLRTDEALAGFQEQATALAVEKADLDAQAAELGAELASLHERRNNIPRGSLELRTVAGTGTAHRRRGPAVRR